MCGARCGVAQADFVDDLPWGLDTRIGEQGLSLSGGQRQRLALARAVVGRPSVLVFDDPLSALDIHTEAQVELALRSVLRGTTALVVAHRASTVLLADRVALLAHGRIAAVGTHTELMATVPEYRALLASSRTRQDATTPSCRNESRRDAGRCDMTATPTPVPLLDPEGDDAWRGVAAEDRTDISAGVGLRLQARSRRLLRSLVRPHRGTALLAGIVVVLSELAYLVGSARSRVRHRHRGARADRGRLPARWSVRRWSTSRPASVTRSGKAIFVRLAARVAQAVLLDLRGRVFAHSQALSLSFHEKYTSGKVISRMTSDLDALGDLAEEGLEGLVSGVLSVLAISVTLLVLDLRLGLIALAAFCRSFWPRGGSSAAPGSSTAGPARRSPP